MAWIELHQTLPNNKKTLRLKRILKIKTPQAVGHLCMLWLWAVDNAPDGDLSGFDAEDIAEVAGWEKNPATFTEALTEAGFLDSDGTLHNWDEYVGMLMEKRKIQDEQADRARALYSDMRVIKVVRKRDGDICRYCGKVVNWNDRRGSDGGTYEKLRPEEETTPDNLVVCCRSCASRTGKKLIDTIPQEPIAKQISNRNSIDSNRYPTEKPIENLLESTENLSNPIENQQEKPVITVPYRTLQYSTIDTPPIAPQGGESEKPPEEKKEGRRKSALTAKQKEGFSTFWEAYPRKVSVAAAEKAWAKLPVDDGLYAEIVSGVKRAMKQDRRFEETQFTPHPASWLNAQGWKDEYSDWNKPHAKPLTENERGSIPGMARLAVELLEDEDDEND